jgi:nucleoside-diphosphate-sugar epimerase
MMRILGAPPARVDGRVYYLGDLPILLSDWVNGFARAITGKPARIVPRPLLKGLAAIGTLFQRLGISFPMNLSRYRSMTEDYFSPVDKTIQDFGNPPYSLDEGIAETVDWLHLYWNGKLGCP